MTARCPVLQPSGRFLYVVPQPAKVDPLHPVAQLQVVDHQGDRRATHRRSLRPLSLRHPGLHRQEGYRSVRARSPTIVVVGYF